MMKLMVKPFAFLFLVTLCVGSYVGCAKTKDPLQPVDNPCSEELDDACQAGNYCFQGYCRQLCSPDFNICNPQTHYCDERYNLCLPGTEFECGNGILEFGEVCDDGDRDPYDGCNPLCNVEDGYKCSNPDLYSESICVRICGNGEKDAGETCDDGGLDDLDGCNSSCQVEEGWTCSETAPSTCTSECGDSKVAFPIEECDDEQVDNNDDCPNGVNGTCEAAYCGDGFLGNRRLTNRESCDDGNTEDGDGCSSTCQILSALGWVCPTPGENCYCQDGYQNNDNDDTCLPSCEHLNLQCAVGNCDDSNGVAHCACPLFKGGGDCSSCVVFVSPTGSGDGSSWGSAMGLLSEAIDKAGVLADANTEQCEVWMKAGTYYVHEHSSTDVDTISDESNAALVLRDNVTLLGGFNGDEVDNQQRKPSTNVVIIDGGAIGAFSNPVYHVFIGAENVVIDGVTIQNGSAIGSASDCSNDCGGAIWNDTHTMTITNSTIIGNSAKNNGGAIYNHDGIITFNGVVLQSNSAANGGAVYSTVNGLITSNYSKYRSNVATTNGGAIYCDGCDVAFDATTDATVIDKRCLLEKNAADVGGAVFMSGSGPYTQTHNCTINSNTARISGGAFGVLAGTLVVADSTLKNNSAAQVGGTIYHEAGTVDLDNNMFSGSTAQTGGVFGQVGGIMTANDCTFQNNYASASGGVLSTDTGKYTIEDSSLLFNTAELAGGAIYSLDAADNSLIQRSTVAFHAAQDGGAFYVEGKRLIARRLYLLDNESSSRGGVAYVVASETNNPGTFELRSSLVLNSTSNIGGFAYAAEDGALIIRNNTFSANKSSLFGQLIYAWLCEDSEWVSNIFYDSTGTPIETVGCGTITNTNNETISVIADQPFDRYPNPNPAPLPADQEYSGDWEAIDYLAETNQTAFRDQDATDWVQSTLKGYILLIDADASSNSRYRFKVVDNSPKQLFVEGKADDLSFVGANYKLYNYRLAATAGTDFINSGTDRNPNEDLDGKSAPAGNADKGAYER